MSVASGGPLSKGCGPPERKQPRGNTGRLKDLQVAETRGKVLSTVVAAETQIKAAERALHLY